MNRFFSHFLYRACEGAEKGAITNVEKFYKAGMKLRAFVCVGINLPYSPSIVSVRPSHFTIKTKVLDTNTVLGLYVM